MVLFAHPSPQPKRHLGQSCGFAWLTIVTDRQAISQTITITTGRILQYYDAA